MADRNIILSEVAPSGRWTLVVYTDNTSEYLRADIRNIDGTVGCCAELRGISLGPYPYKVSMQMSTRWNLPDNVLGLYIDDKCYGLFRAGAGRRRARGKFNVHYPLSEDEIEYFCAKTHQQFRLHKDIQQ